MWALGVQRAWTRALSGNGGWCWGWKVTAGVLGGLYPGKGCQELHLALLSHPIFHRSELEPAVWVTRREHGCAGTSAVSWSQLPVGTGRGAGPPRTPQQWLRVAAPGRGGNSCQLQGCRGSLGIPACSCRNGMVQLSLLAEGWGLGGEQRGWPCCGAGVTSLGLEGAGHGPPCPSVSPQRWGPSLVSTPHSRGVGPELAAEPLPPVLIAPPPSLASCCPPKMAANGGRHVSPPPCPPQHGGGRHVVSLQCCQATGDAALPVAPSKAALGEASPHPDT